MSNRDQMALRQVLEIAQVIVADGIQGLRARPDLRQWNLGADDGDVLTAEEASVVVAAVEMEAVRGGTPSDTVLRAIAKLHRQSRSPI